jgi:hypothetical protein
VGVSDTLQPAQAQMPPFENVSTLKNSYRPKVLDSSIAK